MANKKTEKTTEVKKKAATTKKKADAVEAPKVDAEKTATSSDEVKTVVVSEPKKFANDDLIPCKSLRFGTLAHISKKTGNAYEWSNYGDIVDVAYTDLLAMKSAKSKFIYAPWMMILDEDAIIALKLEGVYDKFKIYEDVEAFLEQSPSDIRGQLQEAPTGFKDLIAYVAASMVRDGSLDSIAIIKAIDDALHKNLSSLIGGN